MQARDHRLPGAPGSDRLPRVKDAAAEGGDRVAGSGGAAPWALLVAIYVLGVAGYSLLAHQSPIPLLIPDEITYGSLARSLANGDGLSRAAASTTTFTRRSTST